MANIALKGSERVAMPGAHVVAPADPTERLEVTVLVRRRARRSSCARSPIGSGQRSAPSMSREEFATRHGADAADLAAVRDFRRSARDSWSCWNMRLGEPWCFPVRWRSSMRRSTFRLQRMQHDSCSYRGRTGSISCRARCKAWSRRCWASTAGRRLRRTFGFDRRRAPPPRSRRTQVAALYGFPAGTGAGQCVALIELGGGFRPADLDTYFKGLGVGSPTVIAVSVDHAQNTPTGDANGPDGEVMLDIEVVGAIVPQATIAVYFAPNTDAGFLDAITTAIHDTDQQAVGDFDQLGRGGIHLDIAGHDGDGRCLPGGRDPGHNGVRCLGRQRLQRRRHRRRRSRGFPRLESVCARLRRHQPQGHAQAPSAGKWFGMTARAAARAAAASAHSSRRPTWQASLSAVTTPGTRTPLSMRGVPDVAGNADPETGYEVRVDGAASVIGGTSAVAPLWAALLTRLNQIAGKPAGLINPKLYQAPHGAARHYFRQQRRLCRGRGLGCLHRIGQPERRGAAQRYLK